MNERGVQPFDVATYRPSSAPLENHHGVLDVWLSKNLPFYPSRGGNTPTIALTPAQHDATKLVYREWLRLRTGRPVGGRVDWEQVSPREMQQLSDDMFEAAGVPVESQQRFYRFLNRFLYGQ